MKITLHSKGGIIILDKFEADRTQLTAILSLIQTKGGSRLPDVVIQVCLEFFTSMDTDIELLNAARARNKDACAKIFDLYAYILFKYARRLCGDPTMADQIVGDVFVKLLEKISCGKGPKSNLRAYLFQMTHNLVIDQRRASRRSAPLEASYSFRADVQSASPSLEDRAMLDAVLKIIWNDLTEDQRRVIILRFIEQFSLNETATILHKQVSHIKMLQCRALTKLRKYLGYSGTETIS